MAATIKIKNSSTAGAAPTSSDLVQGELAVNVTDKRLYTENASGTVVELGTNPSVPVTFPDGSASAPSLTNDGDTNTGLFFPAADTIALTTGGTERLRLDSSGNLGLGVTPSAWQSASRSLDMYGGGSLYSNNSSNDVRLSLNTYVNSGGSDTYKTTNFATIYKQNSGQHIWQTAASGTAGNSITYTQAMTLDASGRLGIGQTSPSYVLDTYDTTGQARFSRNKTTTGDMGGLLLGGLNASSSAISYALIQSNASTVTAGSEAGSLDFYTIRSGSLTQAARIDTSGNLLVANTAQHSTEKFGVTQSANGMGAYIFATDSSTYATNVMLLRGSRNTTNSTWSFLRCYNNAEKLFIYDSGNVVNANNSYGAISDIKLKENIVDATPKLADLMQVRVRSYNMKNDPDQKHLGVIAQELEEVFPAMIQESPDQDIDGNDLGTVTKTVKYSVFVPMLIKAIQELKAEFDAYKATHP